MSDFPQVDVSESDAASRKPMPVLVEVTRGDHVESVHRGAIAVADAAGAIIASVGDIDWKVYPRSAIKPLQAIPVLRSGAADKFSLDEADIALLCASHSSAPKHVTRAEAILQRIGLTPDALCCGAHWPLDPAVARDLARAGGGPTKAHNNCSGKHSGMLATAVATGSDPARYAEADGEVQATILQLLRAFCGTEAVGDVPGVDGCGAPNWPISLGGLARGFAYFAARSGPASDYADEIERIAAACAAHPDLVAGDGRFDTRVMLAAGQAALTKTGAEGVYCGALPGLGIGFAVKISDGAGRASELVVREVLMSAGIAIGDAVADISDVRNWAGDLVGEMRVTSAADPVLSELARRR